MFLGPNISFKYEITIKENSQLQYASLQTYPASLLSFGELGSIGLRIVTYPCKCSRSSSQNRRELKPWLFTLADHGYS